MPIQIHTEEFNDENEAGYLTNLIKDNHSRKWFFNIGIGQTYTVSGTYKEACDSVKKY